MAWYDITTTYLRSKNSGGSVLHTYAPKLLDAAGVWHIGGIVEINDSGGSARIVEPRELIDYSRNDLIRGYYMTINWTGETKDGSFTGATGYSSLEAVLADQYTAGNTLEISLNSGSTWTQVRVDSDTHHSKIEGKNIGIHRELVFITTHLVTTEVAADSGGI